MRDIHQQNQKTNLILHIPHSSHRIPLDRGYVVDKKILDQEIIKLTDWYTDDLFLFKDSVPIKADFSRIFCDTERFSDDNQESIGVKSHYFGEDLDVITKNHIQL